MKTTINILHIFIPEPCNIIQKMSFFPSLDIIWVWKAQCGYCPGHVCYQTLTWQQYPNKWNGDCDMQALLDECIKNKTQMIWSLVESLSRIVDSTQATQFFYLFKYIYWYLKIPEHWRLKPVWGHHVYKLNGDSCKSEFKLEFNVTWKFSSQLRLHPALVVGDGWRL